VPLRHRLSRYLFIGAYTKAHPDTVSFSSFGSGTSNHLTGELLNLVARIKMQHIPYRGSAPSLTDLVGANSGDIGYHHGGAAADPVGQIKALAVATPQRLKTLPDVPTMSESGLPGFSGGTWFALVAPAGTAADILSELSKATSEALSSPDLQKSFETQGVVIENQSSQAFSEFLPGEIEKWHKVVEQIGLVPQ
jgi:tripartite-type tricarboxylate transporter receptor subunit TctC